MFQIFKERALDAFKTHGAFSGSELMTDDPGQAALFYGLLFGWSFNHMDLPGGNYLVVKVGETAVAGMMDWGCYVIVDDVDATLSRCQALGGTVLSPGMDIPRAGRMACIRDPHGAAINIITYLPKNE